MARSALQARGSAARPVRNVAPWSASAAVPSRGTTHATSPVRRLCAACYPSTEDQIAGTGACIRAAPVCMHTQSGSSVSLTRPLLRALGVVVLLYGRNRGPITGQIERETLGAHEVKPRQVLVD